MRKPTRSFFNLCLSVLTCVLVVFLSTGATFSKDVMAPPQTAQASDAAVESIMAGGMSGKSTKRYSVNLSSSGVVPTAPSTMAMGRAEATLSGDRLMVRGNFNRLSSALRDYATDPTNPPNPKITSAVHIHRGEANENGPFQFALTVKMNGMSMGGQFNGEYKLSSEQLQALADGKMYIDIHTQQNRAGELRGYFQPV